MTKYVKKHLLESSSVLSIITTGSGSDFINKILLIPGASKFLNFVHIPYGYEAIRELNPFMDYKYCSFKASNYYCSFGYLENQKTLFKNSIKNNISIGVSSSIKSNYIKKGAFQSYISIKFNNKLYNKKILFSKKLTRKKMDKICSKNIFIFLTKIIKKEAKPKKALEINKSQNSFYDLNFNLSHLNKLDKEKYILFPGSFNPLHFGHFEIIKFIEKYFKKEVILEISNTNVDKETVDQDLMLKRINSLLGFKKLLISTDCKLLFEKAQRYELDIVIGADTLKRLFMLKYYNNKNDLQKGLDNCKKLGLKFIVFDRNLELDSFKIPKKYEELFHILNFNFDNKISSTMIRKIYN